MVYERVRTIEELNQDMITDFGTRCESCRYYLQHYVKAGNQYVSTYCGHCTHGRMHGRKPDGEGCRYYEVVRNSIF